MKKTTLWIVALLAVATLAGCNKAPVENPVQENVNENPVEENIEVENIEENVEEQPVVEETNYEVDYGTSELYSKEDMDSAIAAIMNEFNNEWQVKCEMHKIYYAGDEISQNELWHVQLSSVAPFTQSLVMYSDFHSPVNPEEAGAFDPDQEYTNYNWILWREEGGEWIVVDRWY